MTARFFFILILLAALASAQTPALTGDDVVSLRVRFGLTDDAPQAWDGTLAIHNGEVLALRNWNPHPEEAIEGTSGWKLATRKGRSYKRKVYQEENPAGTIPFLYIPGVVIDVRATEATRLDIATPRGNFTVRPAAVKTARPVRFLEDAVAVDRTVPSEQISDAAYENDFADILAGDDGEVWTAWNAYRSNGITIMAKRFDGRSWGEAAPVAGPGDIYHVQLGRDGKGRLWAVWSEQREGNFDLYGSYHSGSSWSAPERLSDSPQADVEQRLATDSEGRLWVVWQSFENGVADILARRYDGSSWSATERVSTSPRNDWAPAIATAGDGSVYVAWDSYDKGNYDVLMRRYSSGGWGEVTALAASRRFEAHVRLACDRQNRLWAAWNESGFEWGKDTGFLILKPGTQLYQWRSLNLGVFTSGGRLDPVADLDQALPEGLRSFNDLPILQPDAEGRMWLFFRHRTLRSPDTPYYTPAHRANWQIHGTVFGGGKWSEPLHIPFSRGRQDVRWGVTLDSEGDLWAAWPTDFRNSDDYLFQKAEIHAGRLPALNGYMLPPRLTAHVEREVQTFPIHPNEEADLARIRGYKIESGGKSYRIYRGDTHRHTEFSADGFNDGSLIETYRYSIDAAQLDYLGVSDHANGGGQEIDYINWLLPQICDIFHLPGRHSTIYTYERGIGYPNGHRNVLTKHRGIPALPVPEAERKGEVGAAKLYEYLKKYDAIAISHTSATNMGTDWRDNDPEVEPLVEIFQGDRTSSEHAGAPKAANPFRPQTNQGGYRPKGFVWNAWAKGYKLGVQASSDHLSTHISYACTIAENDSREGLLDAMRKRHSYGATDNIVLDYRIQAGDAEYLQGDIIEKVTGPFRLSVKVLGTADVRQIDIIKNNTYIHTKHSPGRDVEFTFTDADVTPGESYYYVRVLQVDEEIAWSSPIWITVE